MLIVPAPILVFAYNRPFHLRKTIEALRLNELAAESDLFVYADGPRHPRDEPAVRGVRSYLRTIAGFRSVTIFERPTNLGLAQSIIQGVTQSLERSSRVIVLEDDIVTSPHFLGFMNDALELYASNDCVASVHGYTPPVNVKLPETFFLRGADCWGWATWKRAWATFQRNGRALLQRIQAEGLEFAFDFNGSYPYTRMLRDQVRGLNDSWAVRWYASAFVSQRLTLYPCESLVANIGDEGSGFHRGINPNFRGALLQRPIRVGDVEIAHSDQAFRAFSEFLQTRRKRMLGRLAGRIWRNAVQRMGFRFTVRPSSNSV